MARDYWLEISIRVADGEPLDGPDASYTMGTRIRVDLNDEGVAAEASGWVSNIKHMILEARRVERERDRKAAEPFWKRWLGGV